MQNTNWKRLLGIALAVPALFFLYEFLFSNGIVVRAKGFECPLIDPYQLREAAMCVPFVVLGVGLFLWGRKKGKLQEDRRDTAPDNHDVPSSTL